MLVHVVRLLRCSVFYSGGHLNPAVTVAVFISGGINIVAVPLYFTAQVAGAIAGSACVLVLINSCPELALSLSPSSLSPTLSPSNCR